MAAPSSSHPKKLHDPLRSFSMKSTNSSSTQLTSSKHKDMLRAFIFSQLYRNIVGALAKAKSIVTQAFKDIQLLQFIHLFTKKRSKSLKNKLFLGSFRLYYDWSTSHVLPASLPQLDHHHHQRYSDWYYDASWDSPTEIPSTDSSEEFMMAPQELHLSQSQLTAYLHWLEQKEDGHLCPQDNDIDKLADMFIANSHEKFKLEKQESDRRFQDMMNRSI